MLFVVDVDAARAALRARLLACPHAGCGGRLHPWTPARTRTVTVGVGQRQAVTPDRGRCRACRVSQTLLPVWYLPRRSASIEVVGAAIQGRVNAGLSFDRVAEVLKLNPATVRGWLRRVHTAAAAVHSLTRDIVTRFGHAPHPHRELRPPCVPHTSAVALAFAELGYAVRCVVNLAQHLGDPLMRRFAPTRIHTPFGLWQAINLASDGRLLTMISSRSTVT